MAGALQAWARTCRRPPILVTLVLVLSYILRRLRQRLQILALPTAPCISTHPLLGQFGHILLRCPRVPKTNNRPDLLPLWTQAAQETRAEGFFVISFFHWLVPFWKNIIILHDSELAKKMLAKDSWGVYRKGRSYRIAADLIGSHGLLASPDTELWRRQRRICSAAFRRHLFDQALAPSVRAAVEAMTSRWQPGETVEFYSDALELTLGVLGRFAFGVDFQGPKLREAFGCVLHRMTDFGRNPLLFATRKLPTEQNRRYWAALRDIDDAVQVAMDRRLAEGGNAGDDLLGQILRAAEGESTALASRLIRENLKTFLFAGHDTTASALSWAVYLLATHPEVEGKVLEELEPLGPEPTCDALDVLPYLDAVVKETLRIYPSAGFTREPLEDVDLGPYTVPKGTEVLIFPYIIHRDERLFPDPLRFNPERWLSLKGAPETAGWMPFSLGQRNCIGAQLAKLEIKLSLQALLTRYRFQAPEDPEETPRVVIYMTLVPNSVPLLPLPRLA